MENSLNQVTSQMVVLPTGVILLGSLLFLALGVALLVAGVRTWIRWRRLSRHYGAGDLPAAFRSRHRHRPHKSRAA